jgi:hypothetical protein
MTCSKTLEQMAHISDCNDERSGHGIFKIQEPFLRRIFKIKHKYKRKCSSFENCGIETLFCELS